MTLPQSRLLSRDNHSERNVTVGSAPIAGLAAITPAVSATPSTSDIAPPRPIGSTAVLTADRLRDRQEFVRGGRGQAAEEHGIDDGEDAGVDADAEGERHYCNRSERRVGAKRAQAVANVLPPRGPRSEPDIACIL